MAKRRAKPTNGSAAVKTFADDLARDGQAGTAGRARLTVERMIVGDVNSLYSRRGGQRDEFEPPDTVLRRYPLTYRVYQEMRDDPIVESALNRKKWRALEPNWAIESGGADEASARNQRLVDSAARGIAGSFDGVLFDMLGMFDMGYAVSEVVYRVVTSGEFIGKLTWGAIKPKDPVSLGFALDDFNNIVGLRHRAAGQELFSADKFIVASWMPQYGNPWGRSDLRSAYRGWFIKKTAWKLRAINLERRITPPIVGRVPDTTDEETRKAFLAALENLQHGSFLILDEDLVFQVIEIAGKGNDEFRDAIQDLNQEITIGIEGSFLASLEGNTTGARATGEVHADVAELGPRFARRKLADDVTDQAIARLVRLNFSDGAVPRLRFLDDPVEAIDMRIRKDEFLLKAGLAVPEAELRQTYGRRAPDPGEPAIQNPPGILGQGPPAFDEVPTVTACSTMAEADTKGEFWRAPDEFEEANKVRRVNVFLRDHQEATLEAMGAAYEAIVSAFAERVEAAYGRERLDPRKVDLSDIEPKQLEQVLRRAMLVARSRGLGDILELVRAGRLASKAEKVGLDVGKGRFDLSRFAEEGFAEARLVGPAPQALARAFLEGLRAVDRDDLDALLKDLDAPGRDTAFTVAGLELSAIEKDVKQLVVQAVDQGWSFRDFRDALNQRKVKYVKPVYGKAGTVGEKVLDYHAETVFRTNVIRAYNDGRAFAQADPVVKELLPGREYSAILDDRTTEICRAWDGFRARTDDPVWSQAIPPLHHNCRSLIIAIDFEDWTPELASKRRPVIPPQPGFGVA